MNPYDEQQVLQFADDAISAFTAAGCAPDRSAAVWLGRMQFDAIEMGYPAARAKHLAALRSTLGLTPQPPQPRPPIDKALPPREQFLKWVEGKPFGQQTLLDLEPTLRAAGWRLTPPNAVGDRTKVKPPNAPWTRVGFGEGKWIWLVQPGDD